MDPPPPKRAKFAENGNSNAIVVAADPNSTAHKLQVLTTYLQRESRPYNLQNIFDNLHGQITKKDLLNLLNSGDIENLLRKEFGKTVVWMWNPPVEQKEEEKDGGGSSSSSSNADTGMTDGMNANGSDENGKENGNENKADKKADILAQVDSNLLEFDDLSEFQLNDVILKMRGDVKEMRAEVKTNETKIKDQAARTKVMEGLKEAQKLNEELEITVKEKKEKCFGGAESNDNSTNSQQLAHCQKAYQTFLTYLKTWQKRKRACMDLIGGMLGESAGNEKEVEKFFQSRGLCTDEEEVGVKDLESLRGMTAGGK